MLDLDDRRWRELSHRGYSGWSGAPASIDPDSPDAPAELRALIETPSDVRRFQLLWPYLCSEGTTYPAAYAAVPYLVDIAARLSPADRFEYVFVVGLITTYSVAASIKPYLKESYEAALPKALALLTETLLCQHSEADTRHLLSAAAALKGHTRLAETIEWLEPTE